MSKKVDAYLFCVNCDRETPHVVEYEDGQLHRIACEECGMAVQVNQDYVKAHYREDFIRRVMSKPGRMTREMEADLSAFIKSLPFRVITKPYRVYKENHSDR